MFGLFKKKTSESDAVAYCKLMANEAEIDPVLDGGLYSGFLIRINETGSTLAPYFNYESARNAFAEDIEDRIARDDFEQVIPSRTTLGLPPPEDDGRSRAVRAVIGKNDAQLMTWNR